MIPVTGATSTTTTDAMIPVTGAIPTTTTDSMVPVNGATSKLQYLIL